MITEDILYNLEEALKKSFIGTNKIQHDTEFYSDSFSDYLNKYGTEELRLCRISATSEDIYFFFCMVHDEDDAKSEEVLSIEIYFNQNGLITDIAVYGLQ